MNHTLDPASLTIDQRSDGALIIRVHSNDEDGHPLPDAVFTFREGEPQFEHWIEQFEAQQCPAGQT